MALHLLFFYRLYTALGRTLGVLGSRLMVFSFLQAKFPFSARSRVVSKAWKSEDISGKWAASSWAKRMAAAEKRSALNDFDRFKLMKAKSARNKILNKAVNVQKRKLSKAGKL